MQSSSNQSDHATLLKIYNAPHLVTVKGNLHSGPSGPPPSGLRSPFELLPYTRACPLFTDPVRYTPDLWASALTIHYTQTAGLTASLIPLPSSNLGSNVLSTLFKIALLPLAIPPTPVPLVVLYPLTQLCAF